MELRSGDSGAGPSGEASTEPGDPVLPTIIRATTAPTSSAEGRSRARKPHVPGSPNTEATHDQVLPLSAPCSTQSAACVITASPPGDAPSPATCSDGQGGACHQADGTVQVACPGLKDEQLLSADPETVARTSVKQEETEQCKGPAHLGMGSSMEHRLMLDGFQESAPNGRLCEADKAGASCGLESKQGAESSGSALTVRRHLQARELVNNTGTVPRSKRRMLAAAAKTIADQLPTVETASVNERVEVGKEDAVGEGQEEKMAEPVSCEGGLEGTRDVGNVCPSGSKAAEAASPSRAVAPCELDGLHQFDGSSEPLSASPSAEVAASPTQQDSPGDHPTKGPGSAAEGPLSSVSKDDDVLGSGCHLVASAALTCPGLSMSRENGAAEHQALDEEGLGACLLASGSAGRMESPDRQGLRPADGEGMSPPDAGGQNNESCVARSERNLVDGCELSLVSILDKGDAVEEDDAKGKECGQDAGEGNIKPPVGPALAGESGSSRDTEGLSMFASKSSLEPLRTQMGSGEGLAAAPSMEPSNCLRSDSSKCCEQIVAPAPPVDSSTIAGGETVEMLDPVLPPLVGLAPAEPILGASAPSVPNATAGNSLEEAAGAGKIVELGAALGEDAAVGCGESGAEPAAAAAFVQAAPCLCDEEHCCERSKLGEGGGMPGLVQQLVCPAGGDQAACADEGLPKPCDAGSGAEVAVLPDEDASEGLPASAETEVEAGGGESSLRRPGMDVGGVLPEGHVAAADGNVTQEPSAPLAEIAVQQQVPVANGNTDASTKAGVTGPAGERTFQFKEMCYIFFET